MTFGIQHAQIVDVRYPQPQGCVIDLIHRDTAKSEAHRVRPVGQGSQVRTVQVIADIRHLGTDIHGINARVGCFGKHAARAGRGPLLPRQGRIIRPARPRILDTVPRPRGPIAVPVGTGFGPRHGTAGTERSGPPPVSEGGLLRRRETVVKDRATRSEGVDLNRIPLVMHPGGAGATDGPPWGAVGRIDEVSVRQVCPVRSIGKHRRIRTGRIEDTGVTVDIGQSRVAFGDRVACDGTCAVILGLPTIGRDIEGKLALRPPSLRNPASRRGARGPGVHRIASRVGDIGPDDFRTFGDIQRGIAARAVIRSRDDGGEAGIDLDHVAVGKRLLPALDPGLDLVPRCRGKVDDAGAQPGAVAQHDGDQKAPEKQCKPIHPEAAKLLSLRRRSVHRYLPLRRGVAAPQPCLIGQNLTAG